LLFVLLENFPLSISLTTHPDISQVAITLVYRYQLETFEQGSR